MLRILASQDFDCLLRTIRPRVIGRNVILSINFMRLGVPEFDMMSLLDIITDGLGCDTLAVQTYSEFSSARPRYFSRLHTTVTPYLSTLSKLAFKLHPNCRLLSPTHSFIGINFDENLLDHVFTSAFGLDSPFGYFLENKYVWLNIGATLSETCTFLHYVEQCHDFDGFYRSKTLFPVKISPGQLSDDLDLDYEYYARNVFSSLDYDWMPLETAPSLSRCVISSNPIVSLYELEEVNSLATSMLARDPWALTTAANT